MIKAVVFDLCGVFIDGIVPLSQKIETKFGIPADTTYPLIKTILKQVRVPGVDSEPLWQPLLNLLNLSYSHFFKFWFDGEFLNQDLLQLTKELHNSGKKVIILSNNFPERTKFYRQQFPELFNLVDLQLFSWETGLVKPDPEVYKDLISHFEFQPEEFVYFDDSDENLTSAIALGIISYKYVNAQDTKRFLANLA